MKERVIECSERMILECPCGERLVLLGRAVDWYSENRIAFDCECGEKLTFADRLEEKESHESLFFSTH
jgi:hypothetical protein